MSAMKVPSGYSIELFAGRDFTGDKYGPIKGPINYEDMEATPIGGLEDRVLSIKISGPKSMAEEEAKRRAKAEADKKAAVAKAKAAAELAKKKEQCKADVVFLMDNTGSMGSVISATKASASNILNKISGDDPRFKGLNVQFGVATYWGDPKEHSCETKPTAGVKLYQHWHYKGREKTYKSGTYNNITGTFDGYHGVSSYKVPSGLSLYMYSKTNGKGTQYGPFDGPLDIPCLANHKGDGCPHTCLLYTSPSPRDRG